MGGKDGPAGGEEGGWAGRLRRPETALPLALVAVAEAVLLGTGASLQWQWPVLYLALVAPLTPLARDAGAFFQGGLGAADADTGKGFCVLSASAFISWIFAKSVYNAAVLGGKFGIVGGLGYAAWYTSFFSAAIVCYRLRVKCGFKSLPEAINARYGKLACLSFFLVVLYRLFNEVWSNAIVVASFYGEPQTASWYAAASISVAVPAVYITIGGLRSSLLSDTIQAGLAVVLLVVVLAVVLPTAAAPVGSWNPVAGRAMWSLEGGLDLLLVGLLQGCLSYPFFDPVLTDRAFLAEPRTMLRAFCAGGALAAAFIVGFSTLGIFGNMEAALGGGDGPAPAGLAKGQPVAVAKHFGTGIFSVINIIMLTSSISTLDSTFSSVSKLAGPEVLSFLRTGKPGTVDAASGREVLVGRLAVVGLAVAGTLPLLANPTALSATTISGTVVMGLGPPVLLLEHLPAGCCRPLAFHLPLWSGVALGVCYQVAGHWPGAVDLSALAVGAGSYGKLLGVNLLGTGLAFALCAAGSLLVPFRAAGAAGAKGNGAGVALDAI